MFNLAIWTPQKPLKGPFTKIEPVPFKIKTKYPKIKGFDYPPLMETYGVTAFAGNWFSAVKVLKHWVDRNGYGQREFENAINYLYANGYFTIANRWNFQEDDLGLVPFIIDPVKELLPEVWHIQQRKRRYYGSSRYIIRQRANHISDEVINLDTNFSRRWFKKSYALKLPSYKAEKVKEAGHFNSMVQTLIDYGYVYNIGGNIRTLLPAYLATQFVDFIRQYLTNLNDTYNLGVVQEPTNDIPPEF